MNKKKKKYVTPAACFKSAPVRRETELEEFIRRNDQLPDAKHMFIMLHGKWGKDYDGMHTEPIKSRI